MSSLLSGTRDRSPLAALPRAVTLASVRVVCRPGCRVLVPSYRDDLKGTDASFAIVRPGCERTGRYGAPEKRDCCRSRLLSTVAPAVPSRMPRTPVNPLPGSAAHLAHRHENSVNTHYWSNVAMRSH